MAKKKSDKREGTKSVSSAKKTMAFFKSETFHFCVGLTFVIFAIFLLLAFASFLFNNSADQSIIENSTAADLNEIAHQTKNNAGLRGAQISNYLINVCFGFGSLFILAFLIASGMKMMHVWKVRVWKWFISCSLLMIWFSLFLGFAFQAIYLDTSIYWGGLHGYNVANWFEGQIGAVGLWLFLLITALCLAIFLNNNVINLLREFFSFKYLKRKKKEAQPETATSEDAVSMSQSTGNLVTDEVKFPNEQEVVLDFPINAPSEEIVYEEPAQNPVMEEEDTFEPEPRREEIIDEETEDDAEDAKEPTFNIEAPIDEDEDYVGNELTPYNPKLDLQSYRFPSVELMKHYENNEPVVNTEEQLANKNRIISTLRSFGIEITGITATVGPTVTLYEITPEQGVRISKIRGLEDDIALSLSALGIRIIAPIPGKGTIGIEVPNSSPKIVSGQSIIGSRKFQESTYDLPIAFGRTITNDVFMVDLCKMPHVLVAGATGQGKSVGLNAIITSLLYKKHPAELKFVLIDPKKVEFSIYSVIENHFLAKLPDDGEPIITDVTKVVQTLNSVCVEMDTRYDLLKMAHVRNIKEYNENFISRRLNPEKGHKFMPYIVVVIDEFGDLIMTAGKEIELPIARIAQLARAVGIHMIIATQRPTTNIITGTIKANFPARVAFRVSSMMDSRTILDRPGANQLIGRGDMLFLQGADPVRVQCAFIDTPEVEEITRAIAKQQGYPTPFYLPEYVNPDNASGGLDDMELSGLDPLFEEAARLIIINQQGSTSLIQRKFAIGYNRAGRIMDQLERAGVVGKAQGSKPREVLCVDERDLDVKLNNLM